MLEKKSPEISHNFSQYLGQNTSYFFSFFILRRDRKAYANNVSYRLPLSTKNWQSYGC